MSESLLDEYLKFCEDALLGAENSKFVVRRLYLGSWLKGSTRVK